MGTTSQTNGGPAIGWMDGNRPFILKSADISLIGRAANDVIQALEIPAGVVITRVDTEIVTACSVASADIDVGDDASTAGYDNAVPVDAAAGTRVSSVQGTDAYAGIGKKYTAANTIDIILTTAASSPTAGAVRLYAHGYYY